MSSTILKRLIKLLTDYNNSKNLTPLDYVENSLREHKIKENEGQHFLHLIKHNEFLDKVAQSFTQQYTLRHVNMNSVKCLFYFSIFLLNECNYNNFLNTNFFYLKNLLTFLLDEGNHLLMTKFACKLFENPYVLESLMYPILNKDELLRKVIEKLDEEERNRIPKRPLTMPVEFECFKGLQKKSPPPPVNTPEEHIEFKARPVPKYPPLKMREKLHEEHLKNREKALKLLEQAQCVPKRLIEIDETLKCPKPIIPKTFKAQNPPPKKDVEIKGNLTSTLREASRLIKEQEEEIKRIEEIVKGGYSVERIKEIENEEREEESRKEMEAIERKHLQGLITYEESLLARKRLLEINKKKMLEFQEARLDLLDRLDRWREEEQNKIMALVEKSKKIKQNAKESEKRIQEEKQTQVKLQQYETREMLRVAYEEKKKELAKKMELIQEIRALQQIGCKMRVKEFDPTECPNFGLLCEMSIAELQERLALAKIRMSEELEEKRKCIVQRKEEQQKMVENMKNFISETRRMSKPKLAPTPRSVRVEQSPELLELKKQLEEKRSMRIKATLFS